MAYCLPEGRNFTETLDSALAASDKHAKVKEARIEQLRKKKSSRLKPEEQVWLNKMLYDEYAVYKADSAMRYVNDNIELARRMGEKNLENEWRINKAQVFSAQGLLSEAEKELAKVNIGEIDEEAKYPYYKTAIYLYSHLAQYIGHHDGLYQRYDSISGALKTEALRHITPEHPDYYSLKASSLSGPSDAEWNTVKTGLQAKVDKSPLNSLTAAMDAYRLAKMYQAEGNEQKYADYLTRSAIADVSMCNRDIASLEELANICFEQGDIDRGYAYINHCLKAALLYPNRVRVVNIMSLVDKFQHAIEVRSKDQEHKLSRSLLVVSILSGLLLLAMIVTFVQFFRLRHAHAGLVESKAMLSQRMEELDKAQKSLSAMNEELVEANEKLKQSNERLVESNNVKEEYVGYVFAICSGYLTKIDDFRKNILRKLKVGKIEDVRSLLQDDHMGQVELREFYRRFDTIFLRLYPNFIEEFNSLYQPDQRIALKRGELLNTELRIYALVRLGINDSVKIAEFLHMSPQTVYNNRLKARNKSVVPKEEFVERVRKLGKNL